MKILCQTLQDITKTNISSRRNMYPELDDIAFRKQRNQQSNFETILQIISMRSQPEDISDTTIDFKKLNNSDIWGYVYDSGKIKVPVWSFTFTVHHPGVFDNGLDMLGKLFQDCHGVPMISGLDEWTKLKPTLNTEVEFRNIYFEMVNV